MKGDYSRETFDPAKSFARVLMQQGRVLLDSDFNEQASILLHYLQTLAADLIGPYGGPAANAGFKIEAATLQGSSNKLDDLHIGAGRYYVDGILCENHPRPVPQEAPSVAYRDAGGREHGSHPHAHAMQSGQRGQGARSVAGRTAAADISPMDASPNAPNFVSFFAQPDYPLKRDGFKFPTDPFAVYLDVWERHINAREDPNILEVALGGPDTTARSKIVWQVKLLPLPHDALEETNPADITCESITPENLEGLRNLLEPGERALLKARTREPEDINATNPCTVSPDARYRGAENHLYRVEIHRGNTDGSPLGDINNGPTFKWSRDNGSKIYPIVMLEGEVVTLGNLGRDDLSSLDVGDWVEILDDDDTLAGTVRPLYQVVAIPDPTNLQVTLSDAPEIIITDESRHPYLRRWDQETSTDPKSEALRRASDGAALVVEGNGDAGWLELEDGIQIQFQPGATYRTGDYWLIPARTATGDVEWPNTDGEPDALPPRGIEHHYAPLAIVYEDAGALKVNDLRKTWGYLAGCAPAAVAVCPNIKIEGADSVEEGTDIKYGVMLENAPPNLTPTFNWTLSAGNITSGQGTSVITVETVGVGDQTIEAAVQVDGLPSGCPNQASYFTEVKGAVATRPQVSVVAPASVTDGTTIVFEAVVHNSPSGNVTYKWNVSPTGAQIVGGAGTPTLQVQSRGLGGQTISATVHIEDEKHNTASATGKTDVKPTATGGKPFAEMPSEPSSSKRRSGARRGAQEREE